MNGNPDPGPFTVTRTEKPWGYELLWALTEHYAAKILHVDANGSLSLQLHREKQETMCVLNGLVQLEIQHDGEASVIILGPGESFHIPAGVIHRLSATVSSDVLEASTPELQDVIRLADNYGRAGMPVVQPSTALPPVVA